MARRRRVGRIISFTPPGVLTGIGQLADVWGNASSDAYPPRIRYIKKAAPKKVAITRAHAIKCALRNDVSKIGRDISRSIQKYALMSCPKDR